MRISDWSSDVCSSDLTGTALYVPFWNGPAINLGPFYYIFAAFVIVGAGNAVNLTDGLDGLATMPVIIASVAFMLIAYIVGRADYATYLGIPHVPGAGDLTIRSEEHTSDPVTNAHLVCRLLLEKKKS